MEQINSYYKKKTVDISGNICNAIEYHDGTQFIQPFFDGETVGWVRDVFINHTKKNCEILIVSPDLPNIWLTMSFNELNKFRMGIPTIGSPVYVITIQKFWHKPENLPYKVYEYCYCDDYLIDYEPPEFMKKIDVSYCNKPENLPYKVYEYCYCDDYLIDYEPPEFMKKIDVSYCNKQGTCTASSNSKS